MSPLKAKPNGNLKNGQQHLSSDLNVAQKQIKEYEIEIIQYKQSIRAQDNTEQIIQSLKDRVGELQQRLNMSE